MNIPLLLLQGQIPPSLKRKIAYVKSMVELSEVVGLGLVIFGTLSLLYGIALCYTVKVRKSLRYDDNYVFRNSLL